MLLHHFIQPAAVLFVSMLKKLLSNLSMGMSTFIFDTSGTFLSAHPIKEK
jgi:hypothetical protein